jgi:hypothetical protein
LQGVITLNKAIWKLVHRVCNKRAISTVHSILLQGNLLQSWLFVILFPPTCRFGYTHTQNIYNTICFSINDHPKVYKLVLQGNCYCSGFLFKLVMCCSHTRVLQFCWSNFSIVPLCDTCATSEAPSLVLYSWGIFCNRSPRQSWNNYVVGSGKLNTTSYYNRQIRLPSPVSWSFCHIIFCRNTLKQADIYWEQPPLQNVLLLNLT